MSLRTALAVALVILATLLWGYAMKRDRDAIRDEYATFVAEVRTAGEAAKRDAATKESADRKRKEQADAENKRLKSANAALARSLRESRSRRGYVPPAARGASSPDRACFDRAELERTIQLLDERISRLIGEGDQAITDLDTAKAWAQ